MPLHWTVESRLKLVTSVAEGDVFYRDIEAYLAMVSGGNLSDWRKLMTLELPDLPLVFKM